LNGSVIAFLVLLGGTPAEHVIRMPSMDDCVRAAEFVAQAQCLSQEDYDRQREDIGATGTVSGALIAPPPAFDPLLALPSAAQRRVRNVLYPVPTSATSPVRRLLARRAAAS
jgi:hypothetical protein